MVTELQQSTSQRGDSKEIPILQSLFFTPELLNSLLPFLSPEPNL